MFSDRYPADAGSCDADEPFPREDDAAFGPEFVAEDEFPGRGAVGGPDAVTADAEVAGVAAAAGADAVLPPLCPPSDWFL